MCDDGPFRNLHDEIRRRRKGPTFWDGYLPPEERPTTSDLPGALPILRGFAARFVEGGMDEEEALVAATAIYYAPGVGCLSQARLKDILEYVDRYRDHRFDWKNLAQLVFLYALGIGRHSITFSGEPPEWGHRWGPAVWTLRQYLDYRLDADDVNAAGPAGRPPRPLREWVDEELEKLGQPRLRLSSEDAILGHVVAVLLGDDPDCQCVAIFRVLHPKGSSPHELEERHRKWHLLKAWLDKTGWPERAARPSGGGAQGVSQYHDAVYPVSQFLFRAVVGDHPRHAKGFEKGLINLACVAPEDLRPAVPILFCGEPNQNGQPCRGFIDVEGRCHEPGCGMQRDAFKRPQPTGVSVAELQRDFQPMDLPPCPGCEDLRLVPPEFGLCQACKGKRLPDRIHPRQRATTRVYVLRRRGLR